MMRKSTQITAHRDNISTIGQKSACHGSLLGIASCTLRALFPAVAEKSSPGVHLPAKLEKISSQLAILSFER